MIRRFLNRAINNSIIKQFFRGKLAPVSSDFDTVAGALNFLRSFIDPPLISILLPVFNTEHGILKQCIESVLNQTYHKWQLCIVDDASSDPHVRRILLEYARKDRRIKLVFSVANRGIAETINHAARLASGIFIGVLDHDDQLEPMALMEYVRHMTKHPEVDVIYCDEDKIDERGCRCDRWHKSDWNPDLLLSFNYVMHFVLYRRNLFEQVGKTRRAYEGSQDYDLLLRVSERTVRIGHIPKILYHWRMGKGSIASGPDAKPVVFVSGLAALQAALDRRGIQGTALDAPDAWKGVYRVRRRIAVELGCTVIVAFRGDNDGLLRLLESIYHHGAKRVTGIIICTASPVGGKELDGRSRQGIPEKWVDCAGCSLPEALNHGVRQAGGDLLLFLDDTFELRSSESVDALIEQAQRMEVGAAGGKVYYANGLVEHGGVIFGPFDLLGYAHRATPDGPGYAGLKNMIGNYSAVMGLGMMTPKRLFVESGGFDATFKRAYWDADYCLRLRARHHLVTYTPYATFTHHIAVPAIEQMIIEPDAASFRTRWQPVIDRDPYFNPNFSRNLECFAID